MLILDFYWPELLILDLEMTNFVDSRQCPNQHSGRWPEYVTEMLILLIHNNKVGHRINKWVAESTKWVTESTKWVTESTNGVITESTKWVWGTVSSVNCVVCACGVCSMVIDRVYSLWCLMPDARALSGQWKFFCDFDVERKKAPVSPNKKSCITCIPNFLYYLYPGPNWVLRALPHL